MDLSYSSVIHLRCYKYRVIDVINLTWWDKTLLLELHCINMGEGGTVTVPHSFIESLNVVGRTTKPISFMKGCIIEVNTWINLLSGRMGVLKIFSSKVCLGYVCPTWDFWKILSIWYDHVLHSKKNYIDIIWVAN